MVLEPVDTSVVFKAPLNKAYHPLQAYCLGWDINKEMRVWTLQIDRKRIILSNDNGAEYNIGERTSRVIRCSVAFLEYSKPYICLEYEDGEGYIYSYSMDSGEINTVRSLTGIKYVNLAYVRALSKDKLVVCALGRDGVYSGTFDEDSLDLKKDFHIEDPSRKRLHRFGLTDNDTLGLEVVTV